MSNPTITAVPGVLGAHWNDEVVSTGVTVLLFPEGATFAAKFFGGAVSTRQVNPDNPHVYKTVHGMCFSGNSAFGLSAGDGVQRYLAERELGFESGHGVVPSVPTAVIFDLSMAQSRIDASYGYKAASRASTDPLPNGQIGAGAGATVNKWSGERLRGGVASIAMPYKDWQVGVLAVVNAVGAIRNPETGEWVKGEFSFGHTQNEVQGDWKGNTTLIAVATNAPFNSNQLALISGMASAGMARTIYPAYTPFDGDLVFSFSTQKGGSLSNEDVAAVGAIAAMLCEKAIVRAVRKV